MDLTVYCVIAPAVHIVWTIITLNNPQELVNVSTEYSKAFDFVMSIMQTANGTQIKY